MKSTEIWLKYVDFEMMQNHMGFMNLLLYQAIKTPLLGIDEIKDKYTEILDTLFDNIVEDLKSEDYKVSDKYKVKNEEVVKLIFEDCKEDKFEFMQRVRAIFEETKLRVNQRLPFEDKIMKIWQE
mmetsp:Transcript_14215/g.13779  ORF Transcript_14215/g.13779 Transcript_14215/m.13779 type:complete len:125 (+) Transcript_14215:249-623(+)